MKTYEQQRKQVENTVDVGDKKVSVVFLFLNWYGRKKNHDMYIVASIHFPDFSSVCTVAIGYNF